MGRTGALIVAILFLGAAAARADECEPAPPAAALAAAKAAGRTVLSGAAARDFVARLKDEHIPIRRADYVFLGIAGGAAMLGWIDDAAAPVALQCEWQAPGGSPLGAAIRDAISAAARR